MGYLGTDGLERNVHLHTIFLLLTSHLLIFISLSMLSQNSLGMAAVAVFPYTTLYLDYTLSHILQQFFGYSCARDHKMSVLFFPLSLRAEHHSTNVLVLQPGLIL